MIDPDKQVWLASGEVLTAAEVLEGFVRLAMADAAFPILSRDDRLKAAIALAFSAVDAFEENEG
jgi:hypothetical protein